MQPPGDLNTTTTTAHWRAVAEQWITWARTPRHDVFFWDYNLPAILELMPAPGLQTLDLGCGEGRLGRELVACGHRVLAIDASPALAAAAATHDAVPLAALNADAGALPLRDASCDLVVACMSLLDIDDLDTAVAEIARVLVPGGALTVALIHPLASAGQFAEAETSPPFVIEASYFDERIYEVLVERDGLNMTFRSWHRPFERYARAFADAGFVIEMLREPPLPAGLVDLQSARERWQRIPNALHIRARRR